MATLGRTALEAFFETGDKPTQEQFTNLIESCVNIKDDGYGVWEKLTVSYTDFQPSGAAAGIIAIKAVPAKSYLVGVQIKNTSQWLGGAITSAIVAVSDATGAFQYSRTHDCFIAPTPIYGVSGRTFLNIILDSDDPDNIYLGLQVVGGVINDLTQGTLDVWLKVDQLPA